MKKWKKIKMDELCCDTCNAHIGYMNNCGPRGMVFCDECADEPDGEEDESK